jgi:putative nucleotidyltransferase with HDIG domain
MATLVSTQIGTARMVARDLLSELPDRWRHTVAVAARAVELSVTVPSTDRELLIAAAWLHDIGYSPDLHESGFHPLDGARHLERHGWPRRVCGLVAHHSGAWFVAGALGLRVALGEFPRELSAVADALAYADQTTGPAGERLPIRQRMAEAVGRHGSGSAQAQVHGTRRANLLAVARRVEQRLVQVRRAARPLPFTDPQAARTGVRTTSMAAPYAR